MSDSQAIPKSEKSGYRSCLNAFFVAVIFVILAGIAIGPMPGGIEYPAESAAMQQARQIDLMMFAYSNDHDQQYPDGQSSTEVFQKLLDGGYAVDPAAFYLPLPGKIRGVAGQKLKPENVGFDVTSGIDSSSPDELPVAFETGYKITYVPSGTAVLIRKSSPSGFAEFRTWIEWWNNQPHLHPLDPHAGIAVAYKNNSARFTKADQVTNPDGSIAMPPVYKADATVKNFIAPSYKPDGKTYRQLTPDGPLPSH